MLPALASSSSPGSRRLQVLRGVVVAARFLLVPASLPATAQVDHSAYRDLRAGLREIRRQAMAVSGRVTETIEIVGKAPWKEEPLRQDPRLKGEVVYRTWGSTASMRSYDWLWQGDRYRLAGGLTSDDMSEETRCDGVLTYELEERTTGNRQAWGTIDRPRGTIPTPATFAYMPSCRWAEDLVADMRLRTVRRAPGFRSEAWLECIGSYRNRYTRLVFDPSRRYAIVEYEGEGDRAAFDERVTQWKEEGGLSVPIAMEQTMRSGPSRTAPVWRTMQLTVSNLRVGPVSDTEFKPQWPEGAEIVNIPEGKMYRYTDGRMEFLMYVGGRTPARMLMGWGVIGLVMAGGMAVVYRLWRRRGAGSAGGGQGDA